MIAKITPKGKSFRGASAYVLKNGRGRIVAGPMAGRTPRELAREFGRLRQLNPKLNKAVAHIILSPAPGDPPISDDQWRAIAECYATEMGFEVWFAATHADTDHPHMHIIACRIGLDGKTISEANDYRRSEAIIRRIERKWGLIAVPSPPVHKSKSATGKKAITTNQGDHSMNAAATPSNPVEGTSQQSVSHGEPFTPAHDLAELTIIESIDSITVPGAYFPSELSTREQRNIRRSVVGDAYSKRVLAIFGDDVTRVFRHPGGAVLYFQGRGRIADRGDKLTVMGGMPEELAARRIVMLAISPERRWKSISFTGSDRFVELAMREAMSHRMAIHAVGQAQEEILAKLVAETRGGMGAATAIAPTTDPILSPLAELDSLPPQTLHPRTVPKPAPVVDTPPAPKSEQPVKAPVTGTLPMFLNLRERILDRRQHYIPAKPAHSAPAPTRKPGSRGL